MPAGRALRLPRCCVPRWHPWPTSGWSPGFHRICELNTTRRQYNKLLFSWKNRFFSSPRPSHHPFRVPMGLQTEIKVSQISALLHNVPDTPFCKQFFFSFFFWLKEHVNMPSEMDGLSLFPSHLLLFDFSNQGQHLRASLTRPNLACLLHTQGKKKNTKNCRITPHRDTSNFYLPWHSMAVWFFSL